MALKQIGEYNGTYFYRSDTHPAVYAGWEPGVTDGRDDSVTCLFTEGESLEGFIAALRAACEPTPTERVVAAAKACVHQMVTSFGFGKAEGEELKAAVRALDAEDAEDAEVGMINNRAICSDELGRYIDVHGLEHFYFDIRVFPLEETIAQLRAVKR